MCNETMWLLKVWEEKLKVEWMNLEGDQWLSYDWIQKRDITTCKSRALQIVYFQLWINQIHESSLNSYFYIPKCNNINIEYID
jgi:hypothetical protein